MQFVNPIEILELSSFTDTSSIDNETIKKAKRRLFADIELSDDEEYNYHGIKITKGTCEKVIDEITTSKDAKEFYFYIANNQPLNKFLVNGNTEIFKNFKQDSIFKVKEFVDFFSPYYAVKFDKALRIAFENDNKTELNTIINTSFLIAQTDVNTAYKGVSNIILNRVSEIDEITKDIRNGESLYDDDDIETVVALVKKYFPSKTLNLLPKYFESQILKTANSINFLSISIWDNFDNPQVCADLLEHILTLNIEGIDKPAFENNLKIAILASKERIEEEQNAPILTKYADLVINTKAKLEEIEKKQITPNSLIVWVNSIYNISEINQLSPAFEEVRNLLAQLLRAMSVATWNSYSNIDISLELINKGLQIEKLNTETIDKLILAKNELTEIQRKIKPVITPQAKVTNTSNLENNDTVNGLWILLLIVGLIVVLFLIFGGSKKSTTYDNQSTPTFNSPNQEEVVVDTMAAASNDYEQPVKVVSKYLGNQLKNGASPLNGCFGKGKFGGQAYITFMNSNSTDAIVCLVSVYNSKTIRNEYIRAGQNYTMKNIPTGTYFLKVCYGNDWNPKMENFCGTKGAFESDVHFSKSENPSDYISIENSEYSYTTGTITLYSVQDGNMSTQSSSQEEFFNN